MTPLRRTTIAATPAILIFITACSTTPVSVPSSIEADNTKIQHPQEVPANSPREAVEFEGTLLERKRSDGNWSGFGTFYQAIRYQVESVQKGNVKIGEITIFYALVGPPLCETDTPELSKAIFKVGQRLHIKAELTIAGDYVGLENLDSVAIVK